VDPLSIAFQVSLFLSVLAYGLGATTDDVLYLFRRPRLLLTSLIAMFVVVPVLALAVELTFDFPYAARVAIVVLALSPVPQLLPRTEIASGGRASYAVGLGFAVSVLSIVVVPVMVHFLGLVMSRPFDIGGGTIAAVLVPTVLLPLGLGMLAQRVAPGLAGRWQQPINRVGGVLMAVALVVLLVPVLPVVLSTASLTTLLAMSVFIAGALLVGHALGGPEPDRSIVLAIACANRNPGIAASIATVNFPEESFGPTVVLYAVLVGVVSKPYLRWQASRVASRALRRE
jgi:BASS family bile acid:Na+ symporter